MKERLELSRFLINIGFNVGRGENWVAEEGRDQESKKDRRKGVSPLPCLLISCLNDGDRSDNAGEVRHVNPFHPRLGEQLHPDLSVICLLCFTAAAVSSLV